MSNPGEVDDVTAFDLQILLPLSAVYNLKTNILSLSNFVREIFLQCFVLIVAAERKHLYCICSIEGS